MIVIVSSAPREPAAFGALCDSRDWPWAQCETIRAFKRLLRASRPAIVIARQRLADGYSDEIIWALNAAGLTGTTKLVVLLPAGSPSALEARQIALGAELVQRDPVRMEVLVEYLQKLLAATKRVHGYRPSSQPLLTPFGFAGARIDPVDRHLKRGDLVSRLAPREVELAELLAQAVDQVLTYETLFNEILGRRFRGDTSNLRVLLGKLGRSARRVGIQLPLWVEVIPKLGYRYHSIGRTALAFRQQVSQSLK